MFNRIIQSCKFFGDKVYVTTDSKGMARLISTSRHSFVEEDFLGLTEWEAVQMCEMEIPWVVDDTDDGFFVNFVDESEVDDNFISLPNDYEIPHCDELIDEDLINWTPVFSQEEKDYLMNLAEVGNDVDNEDIII